MNGILTKHCLTIKEFVLSLKRNKAATGDLPSGGRKLIFGSFLPCVPIESAPTANLRPLVTMANQTLLGN